MARRVQHKRLRLLRIMLTDPEWELLQQMCRAAQLDKSAFVRSRLFVTDQHPAKHGDANGRSPA